MIHNGELEKPVMLLTAGLSTSKAALSSLGISRFEEDCTVQLGRLDNESECAVIRDWLTEAGGVVEDPTPLPSRGMGGLSTLCPTLSRP